MHVDPATASELDQLRGRIAHLVDRTARLHRLTAHLSTALTVEDVAQIVIDEGTAAVGAQTAGLWRVERGVDAAGQDASHLVLLRSHGYSDAAVAHTGRVSLADTRPITDTARAGEPLWLTSHADYVARYPASAAHARALNVPIQAATAALPVVLDGAVLGVLALTFGDERELDADERAFLVFLALHCAQGFERARLYRAETAARVAAEAARERADFLVRASALLGGSLDYEETLRNVAALAVPKIGSWCGVELVVPEGGTKQVAVAHVDPARIALAKALRDRYPTDPASPTGVPQVIRTGVSELYADIPDALLVAGARDPDHLRLMRELQLHSIMIVPIKDRGRVVGVISFVRSREDRAYAAEDLAMAEQLAERAGAAIGNAMLYEQANTAIRIRDEFVLVAGHELRTPLAAMTLHHHALTMLVDDTPIAKVKERGKKLVGQSDRMARLVDELLDVSRISAGRVTLERTTFDLAELVREICERMREGFERVGATQQLELAPAVGSWDRGRIDQIVTNLVANALKYGKAAPIAVTVTRAGDRAVVSIADRGIGIATEDQARIFQRFERAVSPRNFGGLGLGLWIARQLVEAHGGTIAVASVQGQGATFTVSLPIAVT